MSELTTTFKRNGEAREISKEIAEDIRYLIPAHGWSKKLNIPLVRRIMFVDLKDNRIATKEFFRVYSIIANEKRILKQDDYPFIVTEISYIGRRDDIEEAMEGLETYALSLYGDEYKKARDVLLPMLKERFGY